jgi:hypothetical protein
MSWNYRLCKKLADNGSNKQTPNLEYGIYEVYYNQYGDITAHSENPETLTSFGYDDVNMTDEQAKELFNTLAERIKNACAKDVLDLDNIKFSEW